MISVEVAKYIWDAKQAADRVARFTVGKDFPAFVGNELLRAAVERQFEIIGEAFTNVRRIDPALAATIPDLPQAIAFRNVLAHGYATLDHRRVWGVVTDDLERMRSSLERLLAESP